MFYLFFRDSVTLRELMMTFGGFEILLNNLQDSNRQNSSIRCLSAIVKTKLNVNKKFITEEVYVSNDYELPLETCKNVCAFKFDSGYTLRVDRNFLSEKSTYFNVLLCGQFKEAQEEEITLRNVDENSFKQFLNLLSCDLCSNMLMKLNLSDKELIDVIHLTDQYLVEDLCNVLTESLIQLKMSTDSIVRIYQGASNLRLTSLTTKIVEYILMTDSIKEQELFSMFKNLLQLPCTEQLNQELRQIVSSTFTE